MFVALWEFEVKQGSEEKFEKTYGPRGSWAKLFEKSGGYQGTRLLRDVGRARTYLTLDCWSTRVEYEQFLKDRRKEYEALDRSGERLTARERRIGTFQQEGKRPPADTKRKPRELNARGTS